MIQKLIPILNPGHGGIVRGRYQTSGKRSPVWEDGSQYYEGVGNRHIADLTKMMLDRAGVICYNLVDRSDIDVPLDTRVMSAHNIKRKETGNTVIGIDIHSNAGGGSGYEAWTYRSPDSNEADKLATALYTEFSAEFPGMGSRTDYSDGDPDKERADLYMLRNTSLPWVISENLFMDNEYECRNILMTDHGIKKIAAFHYRAIRSICCVG